MKKYLFVLPLLLMLRSVHIEPERVEGIWYFRVKNVLETSILQEATWALNLKPITVTSSVSPRSAGGIHDFFSEGDY
jgi:hypothetical protein